METEKYDFSLILPCYNEKEIFIDSLERIVRVLDDTCNTWEIILIDDASKDNTRQLIKAGLKKYSRRAIKAFFHKTNQGRGKTVMNGVAKAEGKIVGFMDIDLEIGEWYLPIFIKTIAMGADMAIAWRIYDFNLYSLPRWVSSKGYSILRKLMIGLPYKDTESGYKFFNRKKILPVIKKCRCKGWFWDTEILARAYQSGLKVKEIPVAFIKRADKTSTVKLIPDSFRYIKNLINFKLNQ